MHSHVAPITADLLLAFLAHSQTSRGAVSGAITDPSGRVVAGASMELSQMAAGLRRMTTINGAGIYRFEAVDLGAYELKITDAGGLNREKSSKGIQGGPPESSIRQIFEGLLYGPNGLANQFTLFVVPFCCWIVRKVGGFTK